MTSPTDPAFPVRDTKLDDQTEFRYPLTKREYSSMINQAAILSGIYANPDHTNIMKRSMDDIAKEALKHTDTLLAELDKSK